MAKRTLTLNFEQKLQILEMLRTLNSGEHTRDNLVTKIKNELSLEAGKSTVRDLAKVAKLELKQRRSPSRGPRDHTERQIVLAKAIRELAAKMEHTFSGNIGVKLNEIIGRSRMDIDDTPEGSRPSLF